MRINSTKIFIQTGCDILKKVKLTAEQEEALCDDLMMLVGRYAPEGVISSSSDEQTKIEKEDY